MLLFHDFYHRRLCVISEGFPTVTAFVLLIMYFDFAVPILHVTFLAVSTVMHYARQLDYTKVKPIEMGLEEQRTRRILWWFCEYCTLNIVSKRLLRYW